MCWSSFLRFLFILEYLPLIILQFVQELFGPCVYPLHVGAVVFGFLQAVEGDA